MNADPFDLKWQEKGKSSLPSREELRKELQEEFTEEQRAQVWQDAAEALKEYHDNLVERWQKETEVLLVFSGLLSGVLTTFNVQSYQFLQPGPNDAALAVLQQISAQLNGYSFNGHYLNSTRPAHALDQIVPPFVPAVTAVWMNTLWFAGLICSLASASIALIVKQWLNGLTAGLSGTSRENARLRQYRLNGLIRWRIGAIVFIPSLLIHLALVFFFSGLLILLWTLHPTVAFCSSLLVSALVVFHFVVTIMPTIRWDCCYRSPQAVAVYIAYSFTRNSIVKALQTGAKSMRRFTHYRLRCLTTFDLWARRLEEAYGWRGRERSEILRATGELDRSIAVMPYTTTLSPHYLETLHVILADLPREHITPCFDDIFLAWEGQWGKSAWRHTHNVRKEFLVRPVLTALRHLAAIDYEKLPPGMQVQWTAHAKSLLERFLTIVPFSNIELYISTLSLLAAGRGDVAELALSRLENQLAMCRTRGIRLLYKTVQDVLTVYEWRVKRVGQSDMEDFRTFTSWLKATRGVVWCLENALWQETHLSLEERQTIQHRGKEILSYFGHSVQGLDWKRVGSRMSREEHEAGQLPHTFSYSLYMIVTPLLALCRKGVKDVITEDAIAGLESGWLTVQTLHPRVDIAVTRGKLKRRVSTGETGLDQAFADLRQALLSAIS